MNVLVPSHLDLCCLQKLLLSPAAVKELNQYKFLFSQSMWKCGILCNEII